jgi:hypothetical protein
MPSMHLATDRGMNDGLIGLLLDVRLVSAASGDRLQERISITHGQRARSTTAASWASVSAIGGMRRISAAGFRLTLERDFSQCDRKKLVGSFDCGGAR